MLCGCCLREVNGCWRVKRTIIDSRAIQGRWWKAAPGLGSIRPPKVVNLRKRNLSGLQSPYVHGTGHQRPLGKVLVRKLLPKELAAKLDWQNEVPRESERFS